MNWKLILQLSLFGLAMGIATVFVIPSKIEPAFWLVIFVYCAYVIAKCSGGALFLHGLLLGLANSVWITASHVLFFDAYLAHHAQEAAMMQSGPLSTHPRMMDGGRRARDRADFWRDLGPVRAGGRQIGQEPFGTRVESNVIIARMLSLQTERLILRNWLETDVDSYLMLSRDVGYNCFSTPGRFLVHSNEEAKDKIRQMIALFEKQKLGKFPIFLKRTQEFIGTCGLEPFESAGQTEVELGYRLCLKHWGQGYAVEAAAAILSYGFGDLGREKIMAFALHQNRASLKILEKLGFQFLRDYSHSGLPHRLYEYRRGWFAGLKVQLS